MAMETNQDGKSEKFLRDLGKRIDQFMVELKDATNRVEADAQKKYDELKETAARLKKEAVNKERWKEVEDSMTRAGDELEKAFRSAFKKREDSGK
jgi:hypothetical protein